MQQKSQTLDNIEAQIVIVLHSQVATSVTDLIRILKLGGDTFYRHKQVLVRAELIKETTVKKSKVRKVYLELTDNGAKVAVHLERIAELLDQRFGLTRSINAN